MTTDAHIRADVLENCGIAWPNPGMWLQAQQQFQNITSPRNDTIDPEAHAHSPRRRDASMRLACARQINPSILLANTYELMAPSGFQAYASRTNDPALSQNGADPFVGGPILNNNLFKNMTSRNTTSSGDITMKSRSTSSSHDEAMPDISRLPSPITGHRRRSILESQAAVYAPDLMPFGSKEQNRRWLKELEGEGELNGYESQFDEVMAGFSPSRKQSTLSGISAPSNTRASSAANTPPGLHAPPSTLAGSGVVLFEGVPRSVSVTTRDPPPSISRVPSDNIRTQSETRKNQSSHGDAHENGKEKTETTIRKKPVGRPRGRKEGRSSEQGLDVPVNETDRRASTGSVNANAKAKADESDDKIGDGKRKRVSSTFGSKVPLKDRAENAHLLSPTRKVSKTALQDDISAKLGEIDDLTEDGVVVRQPLGELDNIM